VRVLVTGGTGYIGSHTVAALRRRGHDVVVLARNPNRVPEVLGPLRTDAEVVTGDMTAPEAVSAALRGCDAVIHAAGEIGVSGGTGPRSTANLDGVRTVIGSAIEAGADPIVYTSTISAYLPTTDPVITVDTELATPLSAYGRSKRDAEVLVRNWQRDGAPVTSFTIGGVYGPISPHLEGSFGALLGALGTFMLVPAGGLGVIDVRDLAELLTSAVEPGRGARRYLAGGRFVDWTEWTTTLAEAAGVEIAQQPIAAGEMVTLGRQCDEMRAAGKPAPPLSEEAAIVMTSGVPTDDRQTLADLGGRYRPLIDTFRDTVAWLRDTGAFPGNMS
jgi:dihydroflavonol-4-reductase